MPLYDEHSQITQAVDFAYDDIDQGTTALSDISPVEMSCECQRRLWEWAWQDACRNWDGFQCRCTILVWIFNPALRDNTMTEMAGRVGKKKQSLERWMSSFKTQFPEIASNLPHIKHE